LEEEEKKAKERQKKLNIEKGKLSQIKENNEEAKLLKNNLAKKIEEISEGRSVDIIAPKVKIGSGTLTKAKKIDKIAKTDKLIAAEWEKAKKGETSVVLAIPLTDKYHSPLTSTVLVGRNSMYYILDIFLYHLSNFRIF